MNPTSLRNKNMKEKTLKLFAYSSVVKENEQMRGRGLVGIYFTAKTIIRYRDGDFDKGRLSMAIKLFYHEGKTV